MESGKNKIEKRDFSNGDVLVEIGLSGEEEAVKYFG